MLWEMTADGFKPAKEVKTPRGRNRTLTHDGVTLTLKEWSERTGIPYGVIYGRAIGGETAERILHRGRLPRLSSALRSGIYGRQSEKRD